MNGKRPKLGAVFSGEATKLPAEPPAERPGSTVSTEPMPAERVVQLNVAVPESLRRQVKIKALQSGKDMNTAIKELLMAWVSGSESI